MRFPQNLKNKEMYAGHGQVRVKELSTGIYISLSEILCERIEAQAPTGKDTQMTGNE